MTVRIKNVTSSSIAVAKQEIPSGQTVFVPDEQVDTGVAAGFNFGYFQAPGVVEATSPDDLVSFSPELNAIAQSNFRNDPIFQYYRANSGRTPKLIGGTGGDFNVTLDDVKFKYISYTGATGVMHLPSFPQPASPARPDVPQADVIISNLQSGTLRVRYFRLGVEFQVLLTPFSEKSVHLYGIGTEVPGNPGVVETLWFPPFGLIETLV